jgi:tetratricopeptide (TPR) repeat protein
MNINKTIQSAFEYHRKGDLKQAESLYKKILRKQPDNPDILHMLGVVFYQLADYDSAISCIRKALQFRPSDLASAYGNLGLALQGKGLLDEAVTCYQRALEFKPSFAEAHCNLGLALQGKGLLAEAIESYQKAIEFKPSFAEAHCNLGYALQEKGQPDEAAAYFLKAIEMNPYLTKAYYNLGITLQKKGRMDEAIAYYQKAIEFDPFSAEAYCNLGAAVLEKGQFDRVITYCRKAIELDPCSAQAYCNLGAAVLEKGRTDEAIASYQKAIEFDPFFAQAYCNLGYALKEKGQFAEAATHYQKALELNPGSETANYNMSLILLLTGNFEQGWEKYEWRWKAKDFIKMNCFHQPVDFSQPMLYGIDVEGLTILIYAEQGFGDAIQFIRYVPELAQRGANVIIECQRELVSLLKNIDGVKHVVAQGDSLPHFDMHCPLLSLPFIFRTTLGSIPAKVPYVQANASLVQKWRDKLGNDHAQLKIGLSWAGKPTHKNDRNRSCSLEVFSPLAELGDISFYSLQKGGAAEQAKNPPPGMKLVDYTEEISDFSDTAALMENLDLIISVDTSIVHLAGALGKRVWTMVPFVPDWRWMLDREDSPWYPTMRLFRQPLPGDWKSVIGKMKDGLLILLNIMQ